MPEKFFQNFELKEMTVPEIFGEFTSGDSEIYVFEEKIGTGLKNKKTKEREKK